MLGDLFFKQINLSLSNRPVIRSMARENDEWQDHAMAQFMHDYMLSILFFTIP